MTAHWLEQCGFSITEVMISLVAALIVISAVLTFTVASVRSNSEIILTTRVAQELRAAMDTIAREIRRAGYDELAVNAVGRGNSNSPFAPISVVDDLAGIAGADCVILAYDRLGGTRGVLDRDNQEVRGIRRVVSGRVGVLESFVSTAAVGTPDCAGTSADYSVLPATCNASTGWCPLTDPRSVNITQFDLARVNVAANGDVNVRDFDVFIQGQLLNDSSVRRSIKTRVRVRADCIRVDPTACAAAP